MFKDILVRAEDVSGHLHMTVFLSPQLTKQRRICGQKPSRASQQRRQKQIAKELEGKKRLQHTNTATVKEQKTQTKFH